MQYEEVCLGGGLMAIAAANAPELTGRSEPRIAPPEPAKSLSKEFAAAGKTAGITLMPWQSIASRYITAVAGDHWQYAEVAAVVTIDVTAPPDSSGPPW